MLLLDLIGTSHCERDTRSIWLQQHPLCSSVFAGWAGNPYQPVAGNASLPGLFT